MSVRLEILWAEQNSHHVCRTLFIRDVNIKLKQVRPQCNFYLRRITKSLRRHWSAHLQRGKSGQSLDVSSAFDFDLEVVMPLTIGAIVWERIWLKGWTCKAVTAGFCLEGFQVTVVVNFAIEMVVTVSGLFRQNNAISNPHFYIEERCVRKDNLSEVTEFVSEN